jgi:hypothetical protein
LQVVGVAGVDRFVDSEASVYPRVGLDRPRVDGRYRCLRVERVLEGNLLAFALVDGERFSYLPAVERGSVLFVFVRGVSDEPVCESLNLLVDVPALDNDRPRKGLSGDEYVVVDDSIYVCSTDSD